MMNPSDIAKITNTTSAGGYFTITGEDTAGAIFTITISFQEYILLFSDTNLQGIDNAVSAMYDNTVFFSQSLEDLSNGISAMNTCVGSLTNPDDRTRPNQVLTPTSYQAWVAFFNKYQPVIDLGAFETAGDGGNSNLNLSEYRAVLDNINEYQTTINSKSEQWNTRTSSIVSARGTAIDLAKTLLSYIKDALFATSIR